MIVICMGFLVVGFMAGVVYASMKKKPYKAEARNPNIVGYKKGMGIGNDLMLFNGYRPRVWDFYIIKPNSKAERVSNDETIDRV